MHPRSTTLRLAPAGFAAAAALVVAAALPANAVAARDASAVNEAAPTATTTAVAGSGSVTYGCDGGTEQLYTVPAGMGQLIVSIGGGSGTADEVGSSGGGVGAAGQGSWKVSPGDLVRVVVGCAGRNRDGGLGYANGGNGGNSTLYYDGGGGGGSSAVSASAPDQDPKLLVVAGGGGGGGGMAGLVHGHTGRSGVAGNGDASTPTGEQGWKSTGGGGGGGGGAGGGSSNGGLPGHGGSRWGDYGGAGHGGGSYTSPDAISAKMTTGGAPRGDGYVVLTPLPAGLAAPQVTATGCQDGEHTDFVVPDDTFRLSVIAIGAGGSVGDQGGGAPGKGAKVAGLVEVKPGEHLTTIAGCAPGGSHATGESEITGGAGWSTGGDGGDAGSESSGYQGGGGGGSSALLAADGTPLIVAGAGGGGGGEGLSGASGTNGGDSGKPGENRGANGGDAGSQPTGDGGAGGHQVCAAGGGGGGAGYRGGEGGDRGSCGHSGAGGGGGSSYTADSVEDAAVADGANAGNGQMIVLALAAVEPQAPTVNRVYPGDREAEVLFTPGYDGNDPATFTVTSSTGWSASGATSPITVPNLANGIPVTFTVVATNRMGSSPPSAPSESVVPVGVPNEPVATGVSAGDGSLTVTFAPSTWSGGTPIADYVLTAMSATTVAKAMVGADERSVTVGGLANGTSYELTLRAQNRVGLSAPSNTLTASPRGVPDPPTNVDAVSTGSGRAMVNFSPPAWNGGARVTSYRVTPSTGLPSVVTGPGQEVQIPNDVEVTFTVQAINVAGASRPSARSGVVTAQGVPNPPTNVRAVPGDGKVTVYFDAPLDDPGVAPVISYTVSSVDDAFHGGSGSTSPIVITGLTNGTSYSFRVTAYNNVGGSGESAPTARVTPMGAPANDARAHAQAISGDSGTITGTTANATAEGSDPALGGGGHTVWYSLHIASGGGERITLCGSATASVVGVLTAAGGSVGAGSGTASCLGDAPQLVFDVPQQGGDYLIAVDSADAEHTGSFALNWEKLE